MIICKASESNNDSCKLEESKTAYEKVICNDKSEHAEHKKLSYFKQDRLSKPLKEQNRYCDYLRMTAFAKKNNGT
jgi:hypothetical protein